MRYTVRPISDRTAFTGKHRRSLFESTWEATLKLLAREITQLGGRDVVIECDVSERDIRVDGQIYARARPASPAVRVAFDSRQGPMIYATDRFDHWQDNIRAVALGLEALRRVERYGIAEHGEQYTGYKAIEARPAGMGARAAAELLETVAVGDEGDQRERTVELLMRGSHPQGRDIFREARKAAHPDACGGHRELWDQVQLAGTVLGLTARQGAPYGAA